MNLDAFLQGAPALISDHTARAAAQARERLAATSPHW